jgi:hypothetical protein
MVEPGSLAFVTSFSFVQILGRLGCCKEAFTEGNKGNEGAGEKTESANWIK